MICIEYKEKTKFLLWQNAKIQLKKTTKCLQHLGIKPKLNIFSKIFVNVVNRASFELEIINNPYNHKQFL